MPRPNPSIRGRMNFLRFRRNDMTENQARQVLSWTGLHPEQITGDYELLYNEVMTKALIDHPQLAVEGFNAQVPRHGQKKKQKAKGGAPSINAEKPTVKTFIERHNLGISHVQPEAANPGLVVPPATPAYHYRVTLYRKQKDKRPAFLHLLFSKSIAYGNDAVPTIDEVIGSLRQEIALVRGVDYNQWREKLHVSPTDQSIATRTQFNAAKETLNHVANWLTGPVLVELLDRTIP